MAKLLFDDYDFQNKWIRILTHPVLLSFFNSLLIIILIIFGTLIATRDGNFFVGLIGDGWGEVAVIEEEKAISIDEEEEITTEEEPAPPKKKKKRKKRTYRVRR